MLLIDYSEMLKSLEISFLL